MGQNAYKAKCKGLHHRRDRYVAIHSSQSEPIQVLCLMRVRASGLWGLMRCTTIPTDVRDSTSKGGRAQQSHNLMFMNEMELEVLKDVTVITMDHKEMEDIHQNHLLSLSGINEHFIIQQRRHNHLSIG